MSLINSLKGQTQIQRVFKEGKSVFLFPFKIIYLESQNNNNQININVSIWVGKRYLRKAVDRNKVKRRIRAAFQTHEQELFGLNTNSMDCICIYVGKTVLDFKTIETTLLKVGKRIRLRS